MLKPKKKITKKELKKDPFLEFINNVQNWFSDKQNLIYRLAIGIVVVVLVIFFVSNSRTKSNNEAIALLGKALLSQDLGDIENSRFQLQSLVDDYSSTAAGKQGIYHFGKLLYDEENFIDAENYLIDYTKKGEIPELLSAAYKMLASITQNSNMAEDYLEKGKDIAKDTVYEEEMELLYANQLFVNGKENKAIKIVDEILDRDDIQFSTQKKAEELKGKIEG